MRLFFRKLVFLMLAIVLTGAVLIFATAAKSSEKPELTLVIDAGHGGEDGGAISLSGVKESEVNLAIATKIDQITAFFGVRTIMTRESEAIQYSEKSDTIREKKAEDQNRRLQLINGISNAVLISIHQNKFPDGSPFGAQVLFSPTNGSKEFAEYMQPLLIRSLNTKNRRAASKVPNNILLMNHVKCPAILIECGFLSNTDEEKLLMTDAYRLKIAAVIAAGFLENQQALIDINSGGTHES